MGPEGMGSPCFQGIFPCYQGLKRLLFPRRTGRGLQLPACSAQPDLCPFSVCTEHFPGSKKGDSKHGKRKRGRPRKLSKESRDCLENRKSKHCMW